MADASNSISAVASVTETVEAVVNAPETISKIFELAGKLVYGSSYAAAFVIVFPAALIGAAIPKGNVWCRGCSTGSVAAWDKRAGLAGVIELRFHRPCFPDSTC